MEISIIIKIQIRERDYFVGRIYKTIIEREEEEEIFIVLDEYIKWRN